MDSYMADYKGITIVNDHSLELLNFRQNGRPLLTSQGTELYLCGRKLKKDPPPAPTDPIPYLPQGEGVNTFSNEINGEQSISLPSLAEG